jgi:hypothetical protein
MAFPGQHMLLSFGGPLYVGEQWSVSLRSTPNFADGDTAGLDAIAQAVSTWFTTGAPIIGAAARLAYVKFNRIGPDGKYVGATTNRVDFTPVRGGNTVATHPPQISLVATLETGVTRGLANRGRMFLPCPVAGVDGNGRISANAALEVATKVAGLLSTLNALTPYGETRVYSAVGSGASRLVTGVTVGRVLDTMRSRRTSITEERSAAVAVGGS